MKTLQELAEEFHSYPFIEYLMSRLNYARRTHKPQSEITKLELDLESRWKKFKSQGEQK